MSVPLLCRTILAALSTASSALSSKSTRHMILRYGNGHSADLFAETIAHLIERRPGELDFPRFRFFVDSCRDL